MSLYFHYPHLPSPPLPSPLFLSLQRALGTLYSDTIFEEPQIKQPRLIILPQEDGDSERVGTEELQVLPSPPSETSSRRLLEAAGKHMRCCY